MSSTRPIRHRRSPHRTPVIGLAVVVVLAIVVYISYTANQGLPFQGSYRISVAVPGADRLTPTNDVRIAGVRVGQVARVDVLPGASGAPPYARVELSLEPRVQPLPENTTVRVRPASILGATFVDLTPGSSQDVVADGGALPLANSSANVELTDLLDVFDEQTARSTQSALTSIGDGLAGRGAALNEGLAGIAGLLRPLEQVAGTLGSDRTHLGPFVADYDRFARELAPASDDLAGIAAGGARTFGALESVRDALGRTIDVAPGAERNTAVALRRLQPSLDALGDLVTDLRPATAVLPPALRNADGALHAGVAPLRDVPPFAGRLEDALAALGRRGRDPATDGAIRKLLETLQSAGTTLDAIVPAQLDCNLISIWGQSFGDGFGGLGFEQGPAMASVGITNLGAVGEAGQNAKPSPGVAINNRPHEDARECESGNEPYDETFPLFNPPSKPVILDNPKGRQDGETLKTSTPDGVRDRARGAGVLPVFKEHR
ncbi:MAG: phospholipid/cholesterol/gamma-HCH transport system substrate-binding protein [Thermoleophilaceae bacterium]|nr:phospholipid/cholesterol/gamma-HCH transport system substrate-binding protein [Thermoleophilaceae bacterium]